MNFSTSEKTKIYKSDEACAAFLFPFKNFVFDPLIVKSQADQISEDMSELMKNVVTHTPRPEYIKEKFEILMWSYFIVRFVPETEYEPGNL